MNLSDDWLRNELGDDSSTTASIKWSRSHVTTDGQSASLSWNKAPIWNLGLDVYYCQAVAGLLIGALSLTRGRFCRLQLLLVLASAVLLGAESPGTRDHILLSQIRDSPNLYLYPPGARWPSYAPRHWVPFSSPSTTLRATVWTNCVPSVRANRIQNTTFNSPRLSIAA
jgi:hypothetical protein